MKPELGPTPDERAKAKLEELRKAQDRMRAFFAIMEQPTLAHKQRNRFKRRNNKKLLKVRP